MNRRFKVGDRVVVVETKADELRGLEGEIMFVRSRRDFYRVRLKGGREVYFLPAQLDHKKPPSHV